MTLAAPPRLRPYQLTAARAIIQSVRRNDGRTFVVEMSRQSGKNETSAQLEATLLAAHQEKGGAIIKTAPTLRPQAYISRARLIATLRAARLHHRTEGNDVHVGAAHASFLSAEPNSNVVGHTASILLEIDEAQDVHPDKFDRDFRPMASSTNATTVLYGTAWSETSLLEREKAAALLAERTDGLPRVFFYPWPVCAATNPAYERFVMAERDRLGPNHPLFTTQYELLPLPGEGRFLKPIHLAQLKGHHQHNAYPEAGATYVGGLDIAGGDISIVSPKRDQTVLTIARIRPELTAAGPPRDRPAVDVVHQIAWTGVDHDTLNRQLLDLVHKTWRFAALAVDATGLGETIAATLAKHARRCNVLPVKFSQQAKSALGFGLLSAIETGGCKVYAPDQTPEAADFWEQATLCRQAVRPNQLINFWVEPADGHDDYVISLALTVHAATAGAPRIARARPPASEP